MMRRNAARAESMLKLLANANRLMILCALVKEEKNVTQLSEMLGLSQSALSQHLAKLREEGVVSAERRGMQVFYRIASMEAQAILNTLYLLYCHK